MRASRTKANNGVFCTNIWLTDDDLAAFTNHFGIVGKIEDILFDIKPKYLSAVITEYTVVWAGKREEGTKRPSHGRTFSIVEGGWHLRQTGSTGRMDQTKPFGMHVIAVEYAKSGLLPAIKFQVDRKKVPAYHPHRSHKVAPITSEVKGMPAFVATMPTLKETPPPEGNVVDSGPIVGTITKAKVVEAYARQHGVPIVSTLAEAKARSAETGERYLPLDTSHVIPGDELEKFLDEMEAAIEIDAATALDEAPVRSGIEHQAEPVASTFMQGAINRAGWLNRYRRPLKLEFRIGPDGDLELHQVTTKRLV